MRYWHKTEIPNVAAASHFLAIDVLRDSFVEELTGYSRKP